MTTDEFPASSQNWAVALDCLGAEQPDWSKRRLDDYAGEILKPTALADIARTGLETWFARKLGAERVRTVLGELSMGARPDPEADLPGTIRDLMEGRLDRTAFLERFGIRGPQDMELAQPRWREERHILSHTGGIAGPGGGAGHDGAYYTAILPVFPQNSS